MVKNNIKIIRDNINKSAERVGRDPLKVAVVCVTKEASVTQAFEAVSEGMKILGENRVQHARSMRGEIGDSAQWHMIGHMQSNKAKEAVKLFSLIHSIDSLKIAKAVDKEAGKINKVQNILLQVNVSGEESKYGFAPRVLDAVIKDTRKLEHLNILGLMTIPPFNDSPEASRQYFKTLKGLADLYRMKELSMGMTQDYTVAIEEGATMVRVGRAIFQKSDE